MPKKPSKSFNIIQRWIRLPVKSLLRFIVIIPTICVLSIAPTPLLHHRKHHHQIHHPRIAILQHIPQIVILLINIW